MKEVLVVLLLFHQAVLAGFVEVCNGGHFCLDGKPFYFAGANVYDFFGYGKSGGDLETEYINKTWIDSHMKRLQTSGVMALRTWLFSHEEETKHGFEPKQGEFNEREWSLFDYVLYSAQNHGIYVIATLENYWEAFGGIDSVLSWHGLPSGPKNRWRYFNKIECSECLNDFKTYLNHAINRINHYTNKKYKDDQTILSWELMNEPRYQYAGEDTSGKTLLEWTNEMGSYIKSLDSNHLLGIGLEGHGKAAGYGSDEGNPFLIIHGSKYIDWCSAHLYPVETWINLTISQTEKLIDYWKIDSQKSGKPLIIGEFNVPKEIRNDYWNAIFKAIESLDVDGSLFWWYQSHFVDSQYGVSEGDKELKLFLQHSETMKKKNQ